MLVLGTTTKEAPNSGRQDIGKYVGDRESGPGTRIYVEKSGHGPGLRPKGEAEHKKIGVGTYFRFFFFFFFGSVGNRTQDRRFVRPKFYR